MRVGRILTELVFCRPNAPSGRVATYAVLALLFSAGLAHWILFFDYGRISFKGGDWPKEYLYYSTLQQAVQAGTIPFHVDQRLQRTDRFLALPEKVLSPQILMLGRLSIGNFVLANTLVMYAVGFYGCLVIRRRYTLSLFAFAFLYLLFHFNGHITAHLAAGHSMWNGYFLMPFYCDAILRLCSADTGSVPPDRRVALVLALTLFAMNLQGTFHMYIWNVLFIGFVAIFNPTCRRPLATAVVLSGLLSCFVLVPATITFWNADRMFLTGYPSVTVLVDAFVSIKRVDAPFVPALVGDVGWWEYDMFIGAIGLGALLYLGIWLRWHASGRGGRSVAGTEYRQLDWPMIVMTAMSMGALYSGIAMLPVPLLNAEANPSRFLITPFVLLLIISSIRLDRLLALGRDLSVSARWAVDGLLLAGLVQTAFELATHSKAWAAPNWPRVHSGVKVEPQIGIVTRTDPVYEWAVYASFAVSALMLVVCVFWYFHPRVSRGHRR